MLKTHTASRILICTHDSQLGETVARTLRGMGHEMLRIVGSGEQAIRETEKAVPDLALVDMNIPGDIDGVDIAEQLSIRFGVAILYLTSFEEQVILKRAAVSQAYGFIGKDATSMELKTVVEATLHKHALLAQVLQPQRGSRRTPDSSDTSTGTLHDAGALFVSAFDALSAHVAILDENGLIVAVNESWRRFGRDHGASRIDEGVNYLELCDEAIGQGAEGAATAGDMIREIIEGRRDEFHWEYSCQGEKEKRWFVMHVTRFFSDNEMRVLISHESIPGRQAAEERLMHSEERFRTIVENAPIMVHSVSEQGDLVLWNREAQKQLGWTKEDGHAYGIVTLCFQDADVREQVLENIRCADGQFRQFTTRAKDGSLHTQLWADFRLSFGDTISVGIDITGRLLAESALLEHYAEIADLFEKAADGFAVCHSVADEPLLRFTHWNRRMEEITGYTMEELNSQGWLQTIFRDPAVRISAMDQLAHIRQGADVRAEEWTISTKDDSKRVVSVSTSVVRQDVDKVYVLAIVRDITEHKIAEERANETLHHLVEERTGELRTANRLLLESQQTLEALFNACTEPIVLVDARGNIMAINDQGSSKLGIESPELLGKSLSSFLPEDAAHSQGRMLQAVIATGQSQRAEQQILDRLYEATMYPVSSADDLPDRIAIFAKDITEIRESEVAMREAHERLRVAHEALKRQGLEREKAESGMLAAQRRYQLVCECAPVALSIMRQDAKFEYLNSRFTELFGYTLQDVADRDAWSSIVYPKSSHLETVRAYWDEMRRYQETREVPRPTLMMVRCKDGKEKVVWESTVNLDEGNEVSVYRDVTREIELQESLLKAKNDWERTFDAVSDLIMILDQNHNIVRVNRAVAGFFGFSFQDIIGQKCYRIFHQQDRPPSHCPHARVISGQEDSYTGVFSTAGGKTLSASYCPLLDEHDQCIGTVFVGRDVTDQNARENQLRLSEQRFRAIFESTRDPIFIKDASLKYTLGNLAMVNLLGIKESEFVGHNVEDLFSPDSIELLKDTDIRALGGQAVEQELVTTIQGEPALLLVMKTPLIDSSGTVAGICGIIHDLTGRKPVRPSTLPEPRSARSRAMRATLEQALRAAQFDTTILLTGETGAGKDYLAKYIHQNSKRSGGPYFSVNCASLPSELAESELFGHEGGAFTGARNRKRGMLELAESGTLLLNEIGELPLGLQAKLLTFLDTRQFLRVGGEKPVSVNARLIAATNRDLELEAANGRFRPDLLYRLNVYHITVPPLRERLEDIPAVARRILSSLATEFQLPVVPRLPAEVIDRLTAYRWPGNVRELRNVLERALILSGGGPMSEHCIVLAESASDPGKPVFLIPENKKLNEVVADFKRVLVETAIRRCNGNKTRAARLLGIPRSSLFNYQKG